MILETERLALKSPHEVSGGEVCAYHLGNRDFARAYEPLRDDEFYTEEYQSEALKQSLREWEDQRGYRFFICLGDRIVGTIALSNVVMGAFCSCFLGYGLDGGYVNRGYMTEAVRKIAGFAFEYVKLHRIEANVMPRNRASRAVLEKCGFTCEGTSRKYLKINGVWEDHMHYVLLNEQAE